MYNFYLYHKDLGKPIKLKHDPDGWNKSGKTRRRDAKWHGVFFEFSPRLKFVKEGRDIIAFFYERYGIKSEVLLIITKQSKKTKKYKHHFTGRINNKKLHIETLFAECNIEQTGFLQKFKNRQDIKIDLQSLITQGGKTIAAFDNETVDVELHSKAIQRLFKHLSSHDGLVSTDEYEAQLNTANAFTHYYCLLGLDEVVFNEFNFVPTNELTQAGFFDYPTQLTLSSPVTSNKYNFLAYEEGTYQIQLRIKVLFHTSNAVQNFGIEWFLSYGNSTLTTVSLGAKSYNGATISGPLIDVVIYDKSLSTSINLAVGDKIFIYGEWAVQNDGVIYVGKATDCKVEITGVTIVPATTSPMILKHEAFARVVESITDEADSFRSDYYGRTDSEPTAYGADGEGSLRGILPGKLVRGFPIATNHIYTNFKELIETSMALDGVGVGIVNTGVKQRIHVEPISFFYNSNRIAQFKYVKDIEKDVADEYYFNGIHGGFEKWNNEFSNNLDEICANREFTLNNEQVKNVIPLKSIYIGSGYTLEYVRRDRYIENSTKDNDRDNDNFIIQLRRFDGSLVTDKDEDFAELNNVLSPETIYNAKLSVMRNLIRNGPMLRSGCYHFDDEFIKLSFGEANTEFTSRLNTETELVSEKTVLVSKLPKALWIPEYYTFKAKPTEDEQDEMDTNPYGIIEFSSSERDFKKGYLMETTPDDESDLTTFKVLRANV